MERRQLLRLSGLGVPGMLGGCTSIGASQNSPTQTTADSDGEREEESVFSVTKTGKISVAKHTNRFADVYPDDQPFAEVVIGKKPANADDPHGVRIFNEYEKPRDVSLTVGTGHEERVLVMKGEGTISADAYMALAIWRPRTYRVMLDVSGQDVELQKTFEVPEDAWEGRSTQHNVHIRTNGIEVNFVGAGGAGG